MMLPADVFNRQRLQGFQGTRSCADLQRFETGRLRPMVRVMGNRGGLDVANDRSGFRANVADEGIRLLDQTAWANIHGDASGAFGVTLRHYLACVRGETMVVGASPTEAIAAMRIARCPG